MELQSTDPRRHSIDASRIVSGLYQGSIPATGGAARRSGFHVIVLCAEEYQPRGHEFEGPLVVHAPMDDGKITPELWETAVQAATHVAKARRAGKRVLVTCAAGRNRSGLVSALSLMMLEGLSGRRAVALVKSKRQDALTNPYFVKALEKLR